MMSDADYERMSRNRKEERGVSVTTKTREVFDASFFQDVEREDPNVFLGQARKSIVLQTEEKKPVVLKFNPKMLSTLRRAEKLLKRNQRVYDSSLKTGKIIDEECFQIVFEHNDLEKKIPEQILLINKILNLVPSEKELSE